MKAVIVSLSLLLLLIACGKTPEDPGRPSRQPRPGVTAPPAPSAAVPQEENAGMFGTTPTARRTQAARWM